MPGKSAVMTGASVKAFEDVNPAQFVGYRNLGSRTINENTKVYQGEFDFMAMMLGLKPLNNLAAGSNSDAT